MLIPLLAVLLVQQAPGLTLDDALHQARLARGRPISAAAGVAEARAGRRLAGQIPNPSLTYEHSGEPPRQHFFVDQSFAWLLTRGADRAAAGAGIRRAEADSAATMTELLQDARIAFFDALGAAETLRLITEQVGFSDSLTRIAGARLSAGDVSRLEYDQVAQDARRARQQLSEIRQEARSAAATLAWAIGWSAAAPPVPAGALDAGLDADTGIALNLDSIPAVRSAVAESLTTALALRGARLARVPMPALIGGAEWDDPSGPGRTLSLLGVALPLPLWNSGGADVALARARTELAAAETREARLEAARAAVETQLRLAETARRARFARDSLIPAARELRLRAVAAYRAGETGVLPVLDALRSERDVVLTAVRDLQAFQQALARWRALLGRAE